MKVYLCRRKRINLIIHTTRNGNRTTGSTDLNLGVTDLTAFESTQFGDAAENWNLLSKLKNSEWISSKGQITINLEQDSKSRGTRSPVTLHLEGPLLDCLHKSFERFNVEVTLQVFLVNGRTGTDGVVGSTPDCDFNEMQIRTKGDGLDKGAFCEESGDMSENMRRTWVLPGARLADVEISLIISVDERVSVEGNPGDLSCANVNEKLLLEEVRTDLEIIAENGKGVKCLSAFLVVQSEVIKAMLESDMRENQDNRILMEDVSEQGVRALLAYLYCRDLKMPLFCSVLAVELLEISHKYLIGGLEDAVKGILLEKPVKWFEAKAAVRLFYFSGKLDNHKDLRRKALQVLQTKPSEVMACEEYRRLFQVEVEDDGGMMEGATARLQGVKELCDALLSAALTVPPPPKPTETSPRTSPRVVTYKW